MVFVKMLGSCWKDWVVGLGCSEYPKYLEMHLGMYQYIHSLALRWIMAGNTDYGFP